MGYFWCGSTLIAHDKGQEGSKGGNGICYVLGVLPGVGSKAIVDHTGLVDLHACGEGESGAYSEKFLNRNAPDSPSPLRPGQDP
jgi:hypothetical protein